MYCGCNPIARASQLQTAHALIRLMAQKPYASVTVSELCRTAGISRQTFYSLFGSMENVVLFVLQEKACELPCGPEPGDALERLCRCYSRYICRNRDLLKLLVENNVGFLLYRSVYEAVSRFDCGTGAERDYAANFLPAVSGRLLFLSRRHFCRRKQERPDAKPPRCPSPTGYGPRRTHLHIFSRI